MRKPKWREIKEAVRAVVQGPYTSPFPKAAPIGVEHYRGRPEYNEDECVGCGTCFNVCPPGAIEMTDDKVTGKRCFTLHLSRCIFCGECELHCITEKGITNTTDWEMSCTDPKDMEQHLEKDLLICEACDEVIGTKDHVRWVAKRLGHLAYANPTMMLAALSDRGLADREPRQPVEDTADLLRADRLRILCPKCRQVTSLNA